MSVKIVIERHKVEVHIVRFNSVLAHHVTNAVAVFSKFPLLAVARLTQYAVGEDGNLEQNIGPVNTVF